jgi:hypothetical protein
MKRAIQPDTTNARSPAAPAVRSRAAQPQAGPAATRPTQLVAVINDSTQVTALAQLRDDLRQSSRVQNMIGLAAEINQGSSSMGLSAPAQLKVGIPSTLAHSDRISEGLSVAEAKESSKTSEESSCGCGRKKGESTK